MEKSVFPSTHFSPAFVSNFYNVRLFCPPFFIKKGGMIHAVKREQINNEPYIHFPSPYLSIDYRKHESTPPTHDAPVIGGMLFTKKKDRR